MQTASLPCTRRVKRSGNLAQRCVDLAQIEGATVQSSCSLFLSTQLSHPTRSASKKHWRRPAAWYLVAFQAPTMHIAILTVLLSFQQESKMETFCHTVLPSTGIGQSLCIAFAECTASCVLPVVLAQWMRQRPVE